MPVSKKERTTPETVLSKSEPSSPRLPEQQECASTSAGPGSKRRADSLGTGDARGVRCVYWSRLGRMQPPT